jgi:chorismate mutase
LFSLFSYFIPQYSLGYEKERAFLAQKLETKQSEVENIRNDIDRSFSLTEECEKELNELITRNQKMTDEITAYREQAKKETLQRNIFEKEVHDARAVIADINLLCFVLSNRLLFKRHSI